MAGVATATLQGWGVPMNGPPWDHTYAVSSCGLRWGCWGRSAGGALVASAQGSSIIADCLSRQRSEAGIRYGLTGVCHQTANRILYPAQIKVAGVRGYNLSVFLFNDYGQGPWPELSICTASVSIVIATGGGGADADASGNPSEGVSPKNGSVGSKFDLGGTSQVNDFPALAARTLGYPLDEAKALELVSIQRSFQNDQVQLVAAFDRGLLSQDRYLAEFAALATKTMDRVRRLLGDEDFSRVFGEAGFRPDEIIDRETFHVRTARRP